MAKMVKLESLEYREFLDGLGPWGHQGTRVQWEIRDLRVPLEFLVHQDPVETLGKMELQEFLVLPASLDPLEREEWLALLAPEVSRECPVRQGKMASLVVMEQLACKVHRE